MESSSSKVETMMKPVLLKAGIPLAVSLAGFVLARIATRKSPPPTPEIHADVQDTDSFHTLDSDDHADARQEILRLRRRIEDVEDRELQLERRFLYYQGLKDQEVVLMEHHNKMMLEMKRAEFLEREVSLVEAENQRFQDVAKEYLKLLRLDEFLRSENEQLRKRTKKLLRRTKEHSWILRKQCLQIQWREKEISRNKEELQEKVDCIRLMQDEIKELKLIIEQLSYKLRTTEESAASKLEGEKVSIEDYNRVTGELQQLQKHEASEAEELIYLRWSNACLKHELMRRSQEEHTTGTSFGGIEEFGLDDEPDQRAVEQGDSYFGLTTRDHARSRRRKLIAKFKKWVEGSEKTKQSRLDVKERHGNKCFPRHSVSDGAEDAYIPARKSCSSVIYS